MRTYIKKDSKFVRLPFLLLSNLWSLSIGLLYAIESICLTKSTAQAGGSNGLSTVSGILLQDSKTVYIPKLPEINHQAIVD